MAFGKKLRKGIKSFVSGVKSSGRSIQSAFNNIGKTLGNYITRRQDTPRRQLASEIASQKTQLMRGAQKLESLGKHTNNPELLAKAQQLQGLSNFLQKPEMLPDKYGFGFKNVKASNDPEYLKQYEYRLQLVRGAMSEDKLKKLRGYAKNIQDRESMARSNKIFAEQLKIAADRGDTLFFGKGDAARAKALQFFNYYKRDWQSVEGDRYEAILAQHGGMSLYDLYNAMFEDSEDSAMTWWEFVAEWLGYDYDKVDTRDAAWQSRVDAEFAALDSPTQAEISRAWAAVS